MSDHVVHITRSPLAGAPSRLVAGLNRNGVGATLLRFGKITDAQRAFEPNAVPFNAPGSDSWRFCVERVSSASVVHIHNQAPLEALRLLAESGTSAKIVFHFHSPIGERPNFFDHSLFLPAPPAVRLTVPHFHPRCYWDAIAIPNVVEGPPHPPRMLPSSRPSVMFSPSHRGGGRWNAKSDRHVELAMSKLQASEELDLFVAEGLAPGELIERRCATDISIDEVVTGSYHQVSLEAMACGNVPVNNADDLALATFQMAYGTSEPPPFLRCESQDLGDEILRLARDQSELYRWRASARDYFERHMRPDLVVEQYIALYRDL